MWGEDGYIKITRKVLFMSNCRRNKGCSDDTIFSLEPVSKPFSHIPQGNDCGITTAAVQAIVDQEAVLRMMGSTQITINKLHA